MAELLEKGIGRTTADITVVTTAEIVAATSEALAPPRAGVRALIKGYVELSTGVGTSAVTARIRRGTGITAPLVSEASTEGATAVEAATWVVTAVETLGDLGTVTYVVTIQQTGASGNGIINNATIEVELLG